MLFLACNRGWRILNTLILFSGRVAERYITSTTLIPVECVKSEVTGEVLQTIFLHCLQCLRLDTLLSEVTFQLSCRFLEIIMALIRSSYVIQVITLIAKLLKQCVQQWILVIQMDIVSKVSVFAMQALREQTAVRMHGSLLTTSTKNLYWMELRVWFLNTEKAFILESSIS